MVVTLGQQYNTGEKPTVMLYTYINRHAGTPDKNKTKTFLVRNKNRFIIIYSNSIIDPHTTRAFSLEHKKCYNIVIGKEAYIYIYKSAWTFYCAYKIIVS